MDKKELRRCIALQKQALTDRQIEAWSADLARQLFAHPAWAAARSVYAYCSYNQEVRTGAILERALAEGKRLAVPKLYGSVMKFLWLEELRFLAPGSFGIPEPVYDEPEADDETALVIVPGLAFDREGRRCGYGRGYYDRFLSAQHRHPTLALCFDFQLTEHLDTNAHDVPVQFVLSAPGKEAAQ